MKQKFRESLIIPFWLIVALWAIQAFQSLTGISLGMYGVYPREVFGLRGILFSPLLHSGWPHLLANTPPLFALTAMTLFFYRSIAFRSFTMIYLLTGLAVWIFARDRAFHIGASGVVYGLVAFMFWNGIFRRNLKSIVLSLIVVFYYGGMFMGIVPGEKDVSWESHLLGGLVGIFAAFWYKDEGEPDEERPRYSWEQEEEQAPGYFLDRDTFDKTKQQRQQERQQGEGSDWNSSGTW
jgi:membrane associated rhomboid family serine protease